MGIRLSLLILFCAASAAVAAGDPPGERKPFVRTAEAYAIPDVFLTSQDGARVSLREALDAKEKPVALTFTCTSCGTAGVVLSSGFSSLQRLLGERSREVRLVTVSIDPDSDTPVVLREHLRRHGAGPGWDFLTGSRGDIDAVLKAFGLKIASPTAQPAVTLVRMPSWTRWARLRGMVTGADLASEIATAR